MKSHRYTIRIRTTEDPAAFRKFLDDARDAGVISIHEDGSGGQFAIDEIEGTEDA